jgi:hypothetical protein
MVYANIYLLEMMENVEIIYAGNDMLLWEMIGKK